MRRLSGITFLSLTVAAVPAPALEPPVAVAPGGGAASALVEGRCPTFHWAEAAGAEGYQLVIYRLADGPAASPAELYRVELPGAVQGWTPAMGRCLSPGASYAWSVGALGAGEEIAWSEASLFQVAAAPSIEEVDEALAMLQRYREEVEEGTAGAAAAERQELAAAVRGQAPSAAGSGPRNAQQAGAPVPGVPAPDPSTEGRSLSVDSNIELGAASNLFKDGELLLWTDGTAGSTALGVGALASSTTDAGGDTAIGYRALANSTGDSSSGSSNTAVGEYALFANTVGHSNVAVGADALRANLVRDNNTAVGHEALRDNYDGFNNTALGEGSLEHNTVGFSNTAVGRQALHDNTEGDNNTAVGEDALADNTTGGGNTAMGEFALSDNTTGSDNTALGRAALIDLATGSNNVALGVNAGRDIEAGSFNIMIGNEGLSDDTYTIRIGTAYAGSPYYTGQNRTFIAGIRAVTTGSMDAVPVYVDSNHQLGTASSSRRYKEAIASLGSVSERLFELRPVSFRFRQPSTDGSKPVQYGLIAEEVAEVFPELVVYDAAGRPQSVRYHRLAPLLLNELQKQHWEVLVQRWVLIGALLAGGTWWVRRRLLDREPGEGQAG